MPSLYLFQKQCLFQKHAMLVPYFKSKHTHMLCQLSKFANGLCSAAKPHYHNGYYGTNQRQQHVAGIVLDKVSEPFAETYFFVILFHLQSTPKFFLLRLRPKAPLHNTKFHEVALHRDSV